MNLTKKAHKTNKQNPFPSTVPLHKQKGILYKKVAHHFSGVSHDAPIAII